VDLHDKAPGEVFAENCLGKSRLSMEPCPSGMGRGMRPMKMTPDWLDRAIAFAKRIGTKRSPRG
jgi:hypothetical protein